MCPGSDPNERACSGLLRLLMNPATLFSSRDVVFTAKPNGTRVALFDGNVRVAFSGDNG